MKRLHLVLAQAILLPVLFMRGQRSERASGRMQPREILHHGTSSVEWESGLEQGPCRLSTSSRSSLTNQSPLPLFLLRKPRIPARYSARNAHMGLIRAARHAGSRHAPVAEISRVAITARNTLASSGLVP